MVLSVAVSGVDGFVGRHLAAAFANAGVDVKGLAGQVVDAADPVRKSLTSLDVADLRAGWPSHVVADAYVHLAGLAAVGPSFAEPDRYISNNTAVTTALCEHALNNGGGRLVLISSGGVYAPSAKPVTEESAVRASSPYVVSKLAMELQADYYRTRGLDIVVARPFNHIGPGQRPGFIVPDLVQKLSELEAGEELSAGNLATFRDYTDVRDVADAYMKLAMGNAPRPVYNVASGHPHSGQEVLETIAQCMGVPVPPTHRDASTYRPTDNPFVQGDATALRADTGWSPSIPIETSIRDSLAKLHA